MEEPAPDCSGTLPSRSGKILRIRLENFMCYENLNIDFAPYINVVIGQNSKNVISTALIIGLGKQSNEIHDCNNLKQLIRHGAQSATIEITISNDGLNAFERSAYGDRITIVLTIDTSGSTACKLQDFNGRTISSFRAELDRLILHMNIQTDNPICIMLKDAWHYWKSLNPKRLYTLYMKATQLGTEVQTIEEMISQAQIIKKQAQSLQFIHQILRIEADQANEKVERIRLMEPLMTKIEQYRIEQQTLIENKQMNIPNEIIKCQKRKMELEVKLKEIPSSNYKKRRMINYEIDDANKTIDGLLNQINMATEKFDQLARCTGAEMHSFEDLIALIEINEQKINTVCNLKTSEEELKRIQVTVTEVEKLIKILNNLSNLLRQKIKIQFKNYNYVHNYFMYRINSVFSNLVRARGVHGIIKFSHENQSLQLDIQSRGESVSQMKRLTNGDVTAVFLIALLSCVDNPFYFMDDCDDPAYKSMIKFLLNDAGKKKKWFQHVFFTSQLTAQMIAKADRNELKILRLNDSDH